MDTEIIRINENSWRIEDSGVRFFLLTGTDRALLVDSGRNIDNAREIAESLTALPVMLVNTHEEPNYRRGDRKGTILPIREGDVLDPGGRPLEVIHLPGHTPGSIALLDRKNRVLISGDPIQDGRIFMFGRFRNMPDYIRSLEHLRAWDGQFDEIWPSHADIPISPALIRKLHDGALDVLDGKVAGSPVDVHGNQVIAYDLGFCTLLCDQ